MPRKKSNRNKKLLIIAVIFAAIVILIYAGKLALPYLVKESFDEDWFANNCECLEKNRPKCTLSGFEYNKTRGLCVNYAKKLVTYSSLTCSEYNCSGEIYEFNLEKEKWQKAN